MPVKYIYFAEFRYGQANLSRCEVEIETKLTYRVTHRIDIIGVTFANKILRKSDGGVFENESEAWLYLYKRAEKEVDHMKLRLEELVEATNMLASKVKEFSAKPEKEVLAD